MGRAIWRRLSVTTAAASFGAAALALSGLTLSGLGLSGLGLSGASVSSVRPAHLTRVTDTSTIVVPFGSAAGHPDASARASGPPTSSTATTQMPRELVVPDVLAVIQTGIPAADVAKIRKLSGVRGVLTVSGGAIKVSGKPANVIGVSPGQFRSWTPVAAAGDQAIWTALSHGQFVTAQAAERTLGSGTGGLAKGHSYQVTAAQKTQLTFGGATGLGVTGVDAVVNASVAARLGLVKNLAVLINAPGDNLTSLVAKVRAVTGAHSQVVTLQPTTTTKPGHLPVDTSVPSGRPTTYMQLYQESAARYCPGLSWTVLAAIGEVESGDGANEGPSSAGALGPMQFLPSTWKEWGIDGFGDTGTPNIMNPFDAVPSAAEMLCADGAAQGGSSLESAIFDYNHADWYVSEVLAIAREYATNA